MHPLCLSRLEEGEVEGYECSQNPVIKPPPWGPHNELSNYHAYSTRRANVEVEVEVMGWLQHVDHGNRSTKVVGGEMYPSENEEIVLTVLDSRAPGSSRLKCSRGATCVDGISRHL